MDDQTGARDARRPDRSGDDPPAGACCHFQRQAGLVPGRLDVGVLLTAAGAGQPDVRVRLRWGVQACGPVARRRAVWTQSPERAALELARWGGQGRRQPVWRPQGALAERKGPPGELGVPRAWQPAEPGRQASVRAQRVQPAVQARRRAWQQPAWRGRQASWRPAWEPGGQPGWWPVLQELSSPTGWPSVAVLQLPGSHCRRF